MRGLEPKNLLSLFLITIIFSCGKNNSKILQNPYITTLNGKIVYWALAEIELKEIQVPKILLLEKNYTSVYYTNTYNSSFSLYRIINGKILSNKEKEKILYADYHPQDKSKILAYNYSVIYKSNEKMVYLYLYNEGPSYKNNLNQPSRLIPIGQANFFDNKDRTYVYLAQNLHIGIVTSGPYKDSFVIYYDASISRGIIQNLDGFCNNSDNLNSQQIILSNIYCNKKIETMDICVSNPLSDKTCIPPAPEGDDFNSVGYIDTTNLTQLSTRQYIIHEQSAPDTKIHISFHSKKIKSDPYNNAKLCYDYFEANGYTIGYRLNPSCIIMPTISERPSPKGYLSCSVLVGFNNPQSYLEKICYVKGFFIGEKDKAEAIQILKP